MRWRLLVFALLLATPVLAVQPDEVLPDPALEARAREISRGIRCPVCQGETIDDSNAGVARDLRLVVRERLLAGDTDAEVVAFVVDRYGEFVLFEPPAKGANLILWVAGPAMLLGGLAIAGLTLRRRPGMAEATALSPDEKARIDTLMKE
jgi:cytochrome c-type biogenesis protein CcmH